MRPPLGLRPPDGLMRAPQVADFYAAAWPDFTPPLTTFIFVTHSIEEAVYVSDQIAILLPRPSRVSEIIRPTSFRNKDVENIRRDPEYLDIVDEIWASLRTYTE